MHLSNNTMFTNTGLVQLAVSQPERSAHCHTSYVILILLQITAGILGAVLGTAVQHRTRPIGKSPMEGHQNNQRTGVAVLCGESERAGATTLQQLHYLEKILPQTMSICCSGTQYQRTLPIYEVVGRDTTVSLQTIVQF